MRRLTQGSPGYSAAQVGLGLAIVGVGSVAAMAAASRALSAEAFATFATWWTLANLVGLAFAVIEGYLPRLIVSARSSDQPDIGLVATFTRGTLGAVVLLATLLALSASWTVARLFAGHAELLALAVVYMLMMSMQSLQRAVAVGRSRFEVFPAQMGADGLVRVVGSLALLLIGAGNATAFAAVLCASAAVGLAAGTVPDRHWWAWRPSGTRVDPRPLVLLLAASMGPLVVNNVAVPWLAATGQVDALTIGAVAGALTLSRVPTLLVGAAYGPVLTPLAHSVEERDARGFSRMHRAALTTAVVLALLFVVSFTLLGHWALSVFIGAEYTLSTGVLALMACSSGLMFVVVVEMAALVALTAWHRVALAWGIGLLALVALLAAPIDPVPQVAIAITVAPLLAALVMAWNRRRFSRLGFA